MMEDHNMTREELLEALAKSQAQVNILQKALLEDSNQASESLYKEIVEGQTDMITRWMPDTTVTYVNQAYCRYFGRSAEEFLGKPFLPNLPEETQLIVKDTVVKLITGQAETYITEEKSLDAEGCMHWVQWTYSVMRDDAGEFFQLQSVGRDITGQKAATQALEQANAVVEQSPVIVFRRKVVDNMLDEILYVSDNVKRYGYTAEDFTTGRVPFEQTVHPDDLQFVGEKLIGNLQNNIDEYQFEYRGVFPDDVMTWFTLQAKIERDASGEAVLQTGTIIDITDIKKAQEALVENEARLSSLVAAVPDMIFRFDVTGKFVDYKGAEGGTYVPPEVFLGKHYSEILPPNVAALTKEAIEKGAAEEKTQTFEYQLPNEAGGLDIFEARLITSDTGEAVGLIRDVTEQRSAALLVDKRAQDLATVAEVATAVTATQNPQEVLKQVVDLTKERFGFYHAHVYQLNEAGDMLELVSGAGEIGDQMVAEKRTIAFDAEQSLVARAARAKEGVIVNDVTADPNFLPHPLLPDTKAEMAVPMMAGEKVLGVLDVQASGLRRFNQDDADILTTLASQVAVALQNAEQYEALAKAREDLDEALDIAALAYWEFDVAKGSFLFNDDYYERILHTTAEEAGGYWMPAQTFAMDYVNPEDAASVPVKIQEALQAEDLNYEGFTEARLRGRDGQERNILMQMRIVKDTEGNTIKLYGTNQDITDRKQIERALAENEERFRSLVSNITGAVYRCALDADYTMYFISEPIKTISGYPAEDFIENKERTYASIIHPDDVALVDETINKTVETREPYFIEYRIRTADGSERWVSEGGRVVFTEGDQVGWLDGAIFDITDRKQAEARLEEALDIASLAYWEFDVAKGSFLFNDDYYERILHTTAEKAGGYWMPAQTFAMDYVNSEDAASVPAKIQEALQSPDPNYQGFSEARLRGGDGQERNVLMRMRIVKDAEGNTIKLYGTNQDITESKQAEELLARRAQELATVAEVATAVTATQNPQEVLQQVVDLTKERFGLYHAHIYLLNEAGDTLELVSGAGEIGDQMVAEKRTIAFDAEQSLVAQAARTKEGVIVNDVTADPNFLPHPLLPDTKAEMAVPLVVGNRLLGVLDVQSDAVGRFTEEDVRIQTTLASQVAVALQNAEQYEDVRRSEALVRTVVDSTSDWIFIKDLDHRYVMSNQGYADTLHISPEDFIGKNDIELGFPEELVKGDPERGIRGFWADDKQVFETKQPIRIPNDIVQVDGQERIYSTLKTPLLDANGDVTGVLIFARDETEQRKSMQALEQANAVVEQSPVIVFRRKVVDNMLDEILYVSDNVKRYGYTAEDFTTGRVPFEQTVHPDDLQFVGEKLIGNLQNNIDEYQFEYRGVFPDDVMTWFTLQAKIERDASGEAVLQTGTIIDITEIKEAQLAVVENEARFRTLVDAVPDMIFRFDVTGKFVDYKGAEGGTYVPPEVFLGKHYSEVLPPNVAALTKEALEKGAAEEKTQTFEYQLPNEAGDLDIFEARIITSETGEAVGLIRNVTEQRAATALLGKRAQELATVAEVATAVTATQDPESVLKQVVDLTKERFGFYHAHVYQLNEAGDVLELVSGAGEIGDQMVAEKRTIAFDAEQSLVARAARDKKGVIVNDVTADPNFLPHPLLPDTKAEMAVPMMAGEKVLGVLDVQASGLRRFNQDDADILITLASQVAVALQNAEQYEALAKAQGDLDEALDIAALAYWELDLATGNFTFSDDFYERILHITTEEAGGNLMPAEKFATVYMHPDYGPAVAEYTQMALDTDDPDFEASTEVRYLCGDGKQRDILMRMRVVKDDQGKTIKTYGTNQDITDRKHAEAEREVALAETQSQYETSRKLNTASGYADILNTVVGMVNTEKLDRAFILGLDTNEDDEIETLHVIANWDGTGEGKVTPVGTQFPAAVFPVVSLFTTPDLFVFNNFATDKRLDEAMRKWLLGQGLRSGILLPLLDGDRPFAAVFLESKETDYFSKQEERAFELVSAQLNAVVQNELLLQSTAKRARELATVAEVGTAVSTVLESEAMLQQVVDLTKERFELYHAHIYLLDEAGDMLELVSGAGEVGRQMVAEKRRIAFNAEQSLVARAARDKKGVIVNDVTADPNFLPHPLLPDTKAEMAVPLIVGNRLLGVLDVQSDAVGRFTEEDVRIKTTLASQVAVALQNSEQYNQVRQSEALVRNIIDSTSDWIMVKNLEHRYVMVNQGYSDTMHIPVDDFIGKNDIEVGFPEELVKGDPERGIRGFWADDKQVFETKEPIVIERDIVQVDGRERIYSTLKTPLMDSDGNVTGVLIFARDMTEREELLQETRSRAEQEALINAISQKIQATTSVENALQVAIRELGDSLGAEKTSIRLGVDAGQRIRK